ncbi:MAG TPA: histidine kinase [Syntrophobacteraceae bacterium]|jgi:HD-like signal output (HDOD) protein|nr:histidine kinase [Syntrophobacteraceae bacterium]HBD09285.1 histidine kinase [Syntrophobacteraceae bacterium]HBZ56704.1 histidine kinase [Syntrophobacteraceae bacterium]
MGIKERIIDLVRDKRTQLPTLPIILTNILKVASDENASAVDLAAFIGKDQAMANKVLRLANSAYYGLARKVDSIHRAISIIGFNEIVGVAVGMGVYRALHTTRRDGLLNMSDLWLHSIGCSFAAKDILMGLPATIQSNGRGAPLKKPKGDEIFLSGLLHDIGKVLFIIYFPEPYRMVLGEAIKQNKPLHQKENELLGINHAQMAGLIMQRWNFPETLMLPSLYHHQPAACPQPYHLLAMVVELADFVCHQAQIGLSGNPVVNYPTGACAALGFKEQKVDQLVERLQKQRPAIEQFLTAIE